MVSADPEIPRLCHLDLGFNAMSLISAFAAEFDRDGCQFNELMIRFPRHNDRENTVTTDVGDSILLVVDRGIMTILLGTKRAVPIVSTKHLSTRFLQLPPSCRSFHGSPRPQFYEATVASAQSIFDGIHSVTGLPWAYTLPLAALTIRTTLVLPLVVYGRRANQKQMALSPLVTSWTHQLRRQTMAEVGHLGPVAAERTLLKKMRKKRSEIYKRWDCGLWKNYLSFFQLPVWLVAIEAVRKMCGKEVGLLGMITRSITGGSDAPEGAAAALESGKELSLATEGALWFPDLIVPDPHLILPFMLSGVIFANLYNSTSKNPTVFQKRFMNAMKLVALAIGPLTLHVPSAMLIYWISSSSIALGQSLMLEKLMPVKPPVVPCKPRNRGLLPVKV